MERRISSAVSALGRRGAALFLRGYARAFQLLHALKMPFFAQLRPLRPWVRASLIGGLAIVALGSAAGGALWWRLAAGPIAVDTLTPWLTSAVEKRLGGRHRVEVGGTILERDETGRTALRLRDIVVRDAHGEVVASAPRAEVGLSGSWLLFGGLHPVRLSLIGAEMAVRIEPDGQVIVFAGADGQPTGATDAGNEPRSSGGPRSQEAAAVAARSAFPTTSGPDMLAALLGWIEKLDRLGLDGHHLVEIGLKNGSLVVDDRRSGKEWSFRQINLTLRRPQEGGVSFTVSSSGADGLWSLTATVSPRGEGRRAIEAVMRDMSPKDVLLALRWGDGTIEADMPLSGILRAETGPDGALQRAEGRFVAGAGYLGHPGSPKSRLLIDEAQLDWRWDPINRTVVMPMEILSGVNRIMLLAQVEVPREVGSVWSFAVNRGMVVLGAADRSREPPLVLDRLLVRGHFDPARHRLEIVKADLSGAGGGVAFSGSLDGSQTEPRLALGLAATRMSLTAFKRLWPVFVAPDVRDWFMHHLLTGVVDRTIIAVNAPLPTLLPGGPPLPSDGLSIEIAGTATLRPADALPPIRDADLALRVHGRTATVTGGRGIMELPSGRKLTLSNGLFEVRDMSLKPAPAELRLRVEGGADAAAELAAMEALRDTIGMVLDPVVVRGNAVGQLSLSFPLKRDLASDLVYEVDGEVTNFSAERLVRGFRAEAASLRVNVTPERFQVKGDARIGATMVTFDYRKPSGGGDAEARAQMVLDDAARRRLGFDLGGTVVGPVPVKFFGRIATASDGENRFNVEVDLTQARITDLLPGWQKPPGRTTRATFVLTEKTNVRRFDDLVLEGSGALVRGSLELDAEGEVINANFPVFTFAEADKASLKVERSNDGTLRATMRGDLYDGRNFIRAMMEGPSNPKTSRAPYDLDLDIKIGAVAGFNGEAIRGLDLRLTRRNGQIRNFSLAARIGRDAPLTGELRARSGGRAVIYIESGDAGALLRFTDIYSRAFGGRLVVEMDPPTADHTPQHGVLNMVGFTVRGEAALDRVAAGGPAEPGGVAPGRSQGIDFARMRMEFTRSPGRLVVRDGVVWGPAVGATMDGYIDFRREDVRLRGTFVPAYALNNLFARLPIIGLFLGGGENEGVLGVTYEVVGTPSDMVLRVNPVSAVAPGFLRKLFEFRGGEERASAPTPQPSPLR